MILLMKIYLSLSLISLMATVTCMAGFSLFEINICWVLLRYFFGYFITSFILGVVCGVGYALWSYREGDSK